MSFSFKFENLNFFNNKDVTITVQIGNPPLQRPILVKLKLNDNLSNIRKVLENDNIINDTLSFSKKNSQNNDDYRLSEIIHEEKFTLDEIIEIVDGNHTLYLIKNSKPDWQTLNNLRKLDYGCTMAFDGIKIAEKRAFIVNDCELNLIGAEGYKKGRLEFESKNDWMKKTNLFFNVGNINIMNFIKFGLSFGCSQDKNFNNEITSAYKYTELGKILLKLDTKNLKLTDEFKNDLDKAIKSKDPRKFRKLTEEYGQFIPTKVTLGGRVYFKDLKILLENSAGNSKKGSSKINIESSNIEVGYDSNNLKRYSKFYRFEHMGLLGGRHPDDENFNEKAWIESLEDYQNWDRIELQNPINIFQLLPDDLRKETFESIGKRILYTSISTEKYNLSKTGRPEIVDLKNLPSNISEILQNKEADCNIFAAVVDTEESKDDFFNCQIICPPNGKPGLIIHCIQKKFKKREYRLKIRIMIVGYDTDFNLTRLDFNVQLKVLKNEFNSSNNQMLYMKLNSEYKKGPPCIGIPVLNKSDSSNNSLVIGHHFYNVQEEEDKVGACAFSYCLKNSRYVNLPNFTIYTLIISNYSTSNDYGIMPFKCRNIVSSINNMLKPKTPLKPKYVSLYSAGENYCGPIFLKQKSEQIEIKYLKCLNNSDCFICKNKIRISEKNIECVFFDPSSIYK